MYPKWSYWLDDTLSLSASRLSGKHHTFFCIIEEDVCNRCATRATHMVSSTLLLSTRSTIPAILLWFRSRSCSFMSAFLFTRARGSLWKSLSLLCTSRSSLGSWANTTAGTAMPPKSKVGLTRTKWCCELISVIQPWVWSIMLCYSSEHTWHIMEMWHCARSSDHCADSNVHDVCSEILCSHG